MPPPPPSPHPLQECGMVSYWTLRDLAFIPAVLGSLVFLLVFTLTFHCTVQMCLTWDDGARWAKTGVTSESMKPRPSPGICWHLILVITCFFGDNETCSFSPNISSLKMEKKKTSSITILYFKGGITFSHRAENALSWGSNSHPFHVVLCMPEQFVSIMFLTLQECYRDAAALCLCFEAH